MRKSTSDYFDLTSRLIFSEYLPKCYQLSSRISHRYVQSLTFPKQTWHDMGRVNDMVGLNDLLVGSNDALIFQIRHKLVKPK